MSKILSSLENTLEIVALILGVDNRRFLYIFRKIRCFIDLQTFFEDATMKYRDHLSKKKKEKKKN